MRGVTLLNANLLTAIPDVRELWSRAVHWSIDDVTASYAASAWKAAAERGWTIEAVGNALNPVAGR